MYEWYVLHGGEDSAQRTIKQHHYLSAVNSLITEICLSKCTPLSSMIEGTGCNR